MAQRITLYHYTTKSGLDGISNSGRICESRHKAGTTDDARYGDGVYMTALDPGNGQIQLALNNWDGSVKYAHRLINWGRVGHYIAVDLKPSEVVRVDSERDVYKYIGDLIFTADMNPRSGAVTKK